MIWEDPLGIPSTLIWPYVDDFLIHAPTYDKLCESLSAFMDLAVDCGLLCHPGKLERPSQEVKYIGYKVNTEGIPCLKIPNNKRDKALAMVEKLLDHPKESVSALAFSVITGTLESLVEATPHRQGRCYLREMYNTLHGTTTSDGGTAAGGNEHGVSDLEEMGHDTIGEIMASQGTAAAYLKYYRKISLPPEVFGELEWWRKQLLRRDNCRSTFGARGHVLCLTWGDGSGTGTGGTIDTPGQDALQWMGAWLPMTLPFTSNWKELNTLVITLEQLLHDPVRRRAVKGTTVFYFTDNEVSYYISHSGSSGVPALHLLIMRVKDLEMKLGIHLETVHVPGITMIGQGTDGLSRGLWVSANHTTTPTLQYTRSVFDPVLPAAGLCEWAATECGAPSCPTLEYWDQPWEDERVLGQFTLWLPPPTIARQLLFHLLSLWTELPCQTSFALVIPRVMQREWAFLTRFCLRLKTYLVADVPCNQTTTTLPIPLVLMYCRAHTRVLPPPRRRGATPLPPGGQWHRQQADAMRGLSG
jgi:hypothetical protein